MQYSLGRVHILDNTQVKMPSRMGCFQKINTIFQAAELFTCPLTPCWRPEKQGCAKHAKTQQKRRHPRVCSPMALSKPDWPMRGCPCGGLTSGTAIATCSSSGIFPLLNLIVMLVYRWFWLHKMNWTKFPLFLCYGIIWGALELALHWKIAKFYTKTVSLYAFFLNWETFTFFFHFFRRYIFI